MTWLHERADYTGPAKVRAVVDGVVATTIALEHCVAVCTVV